MTGSQLKLAQTKYWTELETRIWMNVLTTSCGKKTQQVNLLLRLIDFEDAVIMRFGSFLNSNKRWWQNIITYDMRFHRQMVSLDTPICNIHNFTFVSRPYTHQDLNEDDNLVSSTYIRSDPTTLDFI
jgi:hypothetical protein